MSILNNKYVTKKKINFFFLYYTFEKNLVGVTYIADFREILNLKIREK